MNFFKLDYSVNEIDDIWYIKIEDLWQYLDGNITKKGVKNEI